MAVLLLILQKEAVAEVIEHAVCAPGQQEGCQPAVIGVYVPLCLAVHLDAVELHIQIFPRDRSADEHRGIHPQPAISLEQLHPQKVRKVGQGQSAGSQVSIDIIREFRIGADIGSGKDHDLHALGGILPQGPNAQLHHVRHMLLALEPADPNAFPVILRPLRRCKGIAFEKVRKILRKDIVALVHPTEAVRPDRAKALRPFPAEFCDIGGLHKFRVEQIADLLLDFQPFVIHFR